MTSEAGAGSIFRFTVPLVKQPEDARSMLKPLADISGLRILIVDDNATNRTVLSKQIIPWGIRSESAEDGGEGLRVLRSAAESGEPFDAAILDIQMPEMDGVELARRVKADPAASSTRLLLLTSVGHGGNDGEEARRAGIEAYLTKPVRQRELHDALATVVGGKPKAASVRERDTRLITRNSLREMQARHRVHVLVADDNPVNQKVAARMLENTRLQRRLGLQRIGSFRGPLAQAVRGGLDGRADARDERLRGHRRDSW